MWEISDITKIKDLEKPVLKKNKVHARMLRMFQPSPSSYI